MGLPWFAMISDKNIHMRLNMWEKKLLTFSIWVFLRRQLAFMVCHDQQQ